MQGEILWTVYFLSVLGYLIEVVKFNELFMLKVHYVTFDVENLAFEIANHKDIIALKYISSC